jgi:hypothetical protein
MRSKPVRGSDSESQIRISLITLSDWLDSSNC